MLRPIPVQIQSVEEHGALVKMAMQEYRMVDEQAAYLVVEGLRRAGYLPAPPQPQAEPAQAAERAHEVVQT